MSEPHSPSSVRWHFAPDGWLPPTAAASPTSSQAWDIPSSEEMERRQKFRSNILEETLQHRRIHVHGGVVGGRNVAHLLAERERHGGRYVRGRAPAPPKALPPSQEHVPFGGSLTDQLRTFGEHCSVTRYHSAFLSHLGGADHVVNGQRPTSSGAISTISVAFSPDSQTMASTHGDHTVKITACGSGHLLQTLEGHPRTPWTVKYHPNDPGTIASGCLGHQVRLWNWETATCLHMIRLEFAIISLSFHPTGKVLAIANGTRLHFWALEQAKETSQETEVSDTDSTANTIAAANTSDTPNSAATERAAENAPPNAPGRGVLTEVEQRHTLRCVRFLPNGKSIIVGGVNPMSDGSRQRANNGGPSTASMSFYLRLWDFDLQATLKPGENNMGLRRRAIQNPRIFVPRALLYNDGGFDVSPDGTKLCACAEYWLPDEYDNAMDYMYRHYKDEVESDDEETPNVVATETTTPGASKETTSSTENTASSQPRAMTPNEAGDENSSPPRNRLPPSHQPPPHHSATGPTLPRNHPTTPQTPPSSAIRSNFTLSPPSPPGRRFAGGLGQLPGGLHRASTTGSQDTSSNRVAVTHIPPPPPPPGMNANRPHNPLSIPSNRPKCPSSHMGSTSGRYVPHIVTISLDTAPCQHELLPQGQQATLDVSPQPAIHQPMPRAIRPRLGQLLEACPLDSAKATAVTCVKFSPSTNFCLIGYGVRETSEHDSDHHPVTALFRIQGGMAPVSTMLSGDDDVNIARFHPDSGYGFVYGTKQGRVRVLSPRPWNYYNGTNYK